MREKNFELFCIGHQNNVQVARKKIKSALRRLGKKLVWPTFGIYFPILTLGYFLINFCRKSYGIQHRNMPGKKYYRLYKTYENRGAGGQRKTGGYHISAGRTDGRIS